MNIGKLIEQSNKEGDDVWIAGGASQESVEALEKAMGFKLPSSYRSFLLNFGGLYVMDCALSGIVSDDPLKLEGGNIYADTLNMRDEYSKVCDVPQHLWVVEPHEDGAYCFDINHPMPEDEFGIVNFEPGQYNPKSPEILAVSFNEYVENWYFGGE